MPSLDFLIKELNNNGSEVIDIIKIEKPTKPMHRVREIQIVSIDISFA